MKVDIGELITKSWQVSWKNKSLWWFGIFLGLLVLILLPLLFAPIALFPFLEEKRMDLFLLGMGGFVVVFIAFFVALYLVSSLMNAAVTLGVFRAIQGEEQMPLIELLRNSLPFFWRVLGVMVLYAMAMTAVNLVIQGIVIGISLLTFGFGALCATPLTLLEYPVIFIAVAWMEQAIIGIVIHKMNVMDAVKQGWQLIRNNLLTVVLVMIVVNFGIGMISMIVVMPMMTPFFVLPFAFIDNEPNWVILSLSVLCGLAFVPLYAILMGWATTFTKSSWVFTYLRLTQPENPQLALQETTTLSNE